MQHTKPPMSANASSSPTSSLNVSAPAFIPQCDLTSGCESAIKPQTTYRVTLEEAGYTLDPEYARDREPRPELGFEFEYHTRMIRDLQTTVPVRGSSQFSLRSPYPCVVKHKEPAKYHQVLQGKRMRELEKRAAVEEERRVEAWRAQEEDRIAAQMQTFCAVQYPLHWIESEEFAMLQVLNEQQQQMGSGNEVPEHLIGSSEHVWMPAIQGVVQAQGRSMLLGGGAQVEPCANGGDGNWKGNERATSQPDQARLCWNCGRGDYLMRNCPHLKLRGSSSEEQLVHRACYYCRSTHHLKRNCPEKPSNREEGGRAGACFRCSERGHFERDCPQPPPDSQRHEGAESQGTSIHADQVLRAQGFPEAERAAGRATGSCSRCHELGHLRRECPLRGQSNRQCEPSVVPPAEPTTPANAPREPRSHRQQRRHQRVFARAARGFANRNGNRNGNGNRNENGNPTWNLDGNWRRDDGPKGPKTRN